MEEKIRGEKMEAEMAEKLVGKRFFSYYQPAGRACVRRIWEVMAGESQYNTCIDIDSVGQFREVGYLHCGSVQAIPAGFRRIHIPLRYITYSFGKLEKIKTFPTLMEEQGWEWLGEEG